MVAPCLNTARSAAERRRATPGDGGRRPLQKGEQTTFIDSTPRPAKAWAGRAGQAKAGVKGQTAKADNSTDASERAGSDQ